QAGEAYDAGASIVHIHGRRPTNPAEADLNADLMREINTKVRARCPGLLINNTTGGGPTTTMADRFATLDAGADLASLNMGPDMSRFRIPERRAPLSSPHDAQDFDVCIPFTYGVIEELAGQMLRKNIKPEMETYHTGQFWATRAVINKGLIKKPYVH